MTTKVTVFALHGWPVDVTQVSGAGTSIGPTQRVPAGVSRDFVVYSGHDLLIHEVQPGEADPAEPAPFNGLPVAGYRPQTGTAVDLVNHNKQVEELALRQLDTLAGMAEVDKRWLQIGRTALEQAFMAINRAVFKPGRAALPGDEG